MEAWLSSVKSPVFRVIVRPAGAAHGFPFLAFDPAGNIHIPLTLFALEAARRLSASTARAYVAALQPFFLDLLQDGNVWDAAPIWPVARLLTISAADSNAKCDPIGWASR